MLDMIDLMEVNMNILNIGYNHIHDADFAINRPNGSGDYMLLLLKSPAIFTFNNIDMFTQPDSFILYNKHSPQLYRAYGTQFANDWFHFHMNSLDDEVLLTNLAIPRDKVIHIGDLNELSIIINNLCYETYSSNRLKQETINLYLQLFFIKLSNRIYSVNNEMNNSHFNKMSIIRAKIYNQPFLDWSIDWLSHELAMSRSSFQHMYKHFFGVSPMADVIMSRLEHAKYLLSTTDISVKKIAEKCGYSNEIHFMRQFKRQNQITPTEYRNQKRKPF
jgi:AraC family transcriptional regulator of arabinose operon